MSINDEKNPNVPNKRNLSIPKRTTDFFPKKHGANDRETNNLLCRDQNIQNEVIYP